MREVYCHECHLTIFQGQKRISFREPNSITKENPDGNQITFHSRDEKPCYDNYLNRKAVNRVLNHEPAYRPN